MNIFKLHCSAQFCASLAYALLVTMNCIKFCAKLNTELSTRRKMSRLQGSNLVFLLDVETLFPTEPNRDDPQKT